jgi:hypothetical protein
MNKTNGAINSKHGLSTLMRPKFGPGMLLQHEDLEQLNVYTRELSRLMFRSLFGCGVTCGLVVSTEEKCGKMTVKVGKGVALACSGDPVYVPDDVNVPIVDECNGEVPDTFWVVLCSTVKCCSPRTAICSSDDDDAASDCTREKDGWEIRLVNPRPACACGCEEPETPEEDRVGETDCYCVEPYQENLPHFKCYQAHYEGECGCNCADCSDCDCECILLARVDKQTTATGNKWYVDHRVRRFVRPVLMRDRQLEKDKSARTQGTAAADPNIDPSVDYLSGQYSERKMMPLRQTLSSFSPANREKLGAILALTPKRERPQRLEEMLTKYRELMLAPNIPAQNRNLSYQLDADLAQLPKRGASQAKPQKTR